MVTLFLLGALAGAAPAADGVPWLDPLCARFAGFDQDGDGVVELDTLAPLVAAGDSGPRVLVLVEPRLLEDRDGAEPLRPRLERLVADLGREGRQAAAIAVRLGVTDRHQDGRFVLALREFLRAVHADARLEGVLLVGHFPDAFLVRTCSWRRQEDVVLGRGTDHERRYPDTHWVRRFPEAVADRCDLVLADLDGHWEDVYVQPRTLLPATAAVFPGRIPAHGGRAVDVEVTTVPFVDFFHVSDGKLEVAEHPATAAEERSFTVTLFDRSGDHECSDADRLLPNVIAHPDIRVSRVDARGVALRPRAEGKGREADPVFERRLLAGFLDRDHAYRTGAAAVAWRPASFAHALGSGYGEMRKAARDWADEDPARADVHGRPTPERFREWLAYGAVLRTVRAHSDAWGSAFEGGKMDWALLHSLYEAGTVDPEPCFYHDTGCNGISPPGAADLAYDDPAYGQGQGAEALLLFGNGLALVGRAKVFYDEPTGFAAALAEGRTFGDAWARYFDVESRAATWSAAGGDIGRKRSYFWSVLGDWSLRLARPPAEDPP